MKVKHKESRTPPANHARDAERAISRVIELQLVVRKSVRTENNDISTSLKRNDILMISTVGFCHPANHSDSRQTVTIKMFKQVSLVDR